MSETLTGTKPRTIAERYRVLKTLGRGGMGTVFLVEDLKLKKERVALKELHSDHLKDPIQKERFIKEVQLMRQVNHPNVIRTFEVFNSNTSAFFTMEYLEGRPLDYFLDETEFPATQIPDLLKQVSSGLSAIHQSGVVHRDLKPGNILVQRDGRAKITDFGVARTRDSNLTAHNEIIGSPNYVAPEIWLGKEITPASDLYSLGIILYELLTGDVPFDSDSPGALMKLHLDKEVVAPKELNAKVPAWLSRLAIQLLEKTPEERPDSAQAVCDYVSSYSERGFSLGSLSSDKVAENLTQKFVNSLEEITKTELESPNSIRETFSENLHEELPLAQFKPKPFKPESMHLLPKFEGVLILIFILLLASEITNLMPSLSTSLIAPSLLASTSLLLAIPSSVLASLRGHSLKRVFLSSFILNLFLILVIVLDQGILNSDGLVYEARSACQRFWKILSGKGLLSFSICTWAVAITYYLHLLVGAPKSNLKKSSN